MKFKITLNDRTYEVEVETCEPQTLEDYLAIAPTAPVTAPVTEASEAPAAAAPAVAGEGTAITAPMPGTILKVNAAKGDSVKAGQVLVVLEAMKMENEILAPKDGVVSQVVTTKGSTVDTGAPLLFLA